MPFVRARHALGRIGAPAGSYPDFIIIGAQRCGTTSLYWWLSKHPDVAAAATKELHFFDLGYDRTLGWYRRQFPSTHERKRHLESSGHVLVAGEASPYYLFHPDAAMRVARDVPGARLIVLLRDPVDRAFSHYHHQVRLKQETLSFEAALAAESDRLVGGDPMVIRSHSYHARGVYLEQLERWYAHFPAEQILVVISEELFAMPARELARVQAFLRLSRRSDVEFAAKNTLSYDDMEPETCSSLARRYELDNQRLARRLGRPLPWLGG
jgi:hypothetical protein